MERSLTLSRFIIAGSYQPGEDVQIFLLNVQENKDLTDPGIIPREQQDDISRYKLPIDVSRRLLARSFLYTYLAEKFSIRDFTLGFTEFKKPFLKSDPGIQFNFSYSGNYVVIGVSQKSQLGVDIETFKKEIDITGIAPVIMSASELSTFNSFTAGSAGQYNYFFQLFSCKEAIVKAYGTGLYFDPRMLETLTEPVFHFNGKKFKLENPELRKTEYVLSVCYEII